MIGRWRGDLIGEEVKKMADKDLIMFKQRMIL